MQAYNEGKCCFDTPIRPSSVSCDFRFVRIKSGGVTVSKPPIIDYGGIVGKDSTVHASFCTTSRADDSATAITIEFLDEDSNVVCIKEDQAWCNCPCSLANSPIAPGISKKIIEGVFKKADNDSSGNCCWEFTLNNNFSCSFLDSSFVLQASVSFGSATFTTVAPWVKSVVSGVSIFTLPGGLQYNSSSKVFKVCTSPQTENTYPPQLSVSFNREVSIGPNSPCTSFRLPLECRADSNCCDLLDIKLQRKSQTAYSDCDFDLIVRHKNATSKCKVFGIRVKDTNGIVLHTTDTTSTPLNLDKSKVIWSSTLGGDCTTSEQAGYGKKAYYTIEILDSLGAVKCSVADSFRCCYTSGVVMGKDAIQEEAPSAELPTGGAITNAYIEGKKLHYVINNKSAAARATLWIAGMKGEVIMNYEGELASGMNARELDVSRLASGAYYLMVQTPSWQTSRQFIVIR